MKATVSPEEYEKAAVEIERERMLGLCGGQSYGIKLSAAMRAGSSEIERLRRVLRDTHGALEREREQLTRYFEVAKRDEARWSEILLELEYGAPQ